MDVKITILQVEVARLRPNPWNTNSVGAQNFEKLKGSIEKLGFFKPILARELDGGLFEILGGEHRWRAAMEQGISTVPVISVGKISDLVAKQMSLVDNERYGEDDQVALQRLIEEIQSELDYQLSEIAPYDDELAATLARESAIDLEMLEALSRGDEEPVPNLVFGELTPSQVAQLRKEDDEPEVIDDDLLESLEEEALSEAESDFDASGEDDDGDA